MRLIILVFAVSAVVQGQSGCRPEDARFVTGCLQPMIDISQTLAQRNPRINQLTYPLFYFANRDMLAICETWLDVNRHCLTPDVRALCPEHGLYKILEPLFGYACSDQTGREFFFHYNCISRVISSIDSCTRFIQAPSDPNAFRDRCESMPQYFACVKSQVEHHCGIAAHDVLSRAIQFYGCDLSGLPPQSEFAQEQVQQAVNQPQNGQNPPGPSEPLRTIQPPQPSEPETPIEPDTQQATQRETEIQRTDDPDSSTVLPETSASGRQTTISEPAEVSHPRSTKITRKPAAPTPDTPADDATKSDGPDEAKTTEESKHRTDTSPAVSNSQEKKMEHEAKNVRLSIDKSNEMGKKSSEVEVDIEIEAANAESMEKIEMAMKKMMNASGSAEELTNKTMGMKKDMIPAVQVEVSEGSEGAPLTVNIIEPNDGSDSDNDSGPDESNQTEMGKSTADTTMAKSTRKSPEAKSTAMTPKRRTSGQPVPTAATEKPDSPTATTKRAQRRRQPSENDVTVDEKDECTKDLRRRSHACLDPLLELWKNHTKHDEDLKKLLFGLLTMRREQVLELCDLYASSFLDCELETFYQCRNDDLVKFADTQFGYACGNAPAYFRKFDCLSVITRDSEECRRHLRTDPLKTLDEQCSDLDQFSNCVQPEVEELCSANSMDILREAITYFGCVDL